MMTERVKRMKEKALSTPITLGVEKLEIACDTLDEYRNCTNFVYRAGLLANYFRRFTAWIPDDDLIAGVGASHYNGSEIDFEMGLWSREEIAGLKAASSNVYISPEDEEKLYALNERMEKAAVNAHHYDYLASMEWDNDDMRSFLKSGVVLPVWKNRDSGSTNAIAQTGLGVGLGFVLCCVEYDRVINQGVRAMIDECKGYIAGMRCTTMEDMEKFEFWTSMIKVYEAWINYANRHADEAERLASECTDEKRRAELLQMAEICRRVPEYPARNFREALQAFWFTFLATSSNTMSGGRIDQYLYPYYRQDIDNGTITDDEVLELLEIIRIKCMTWHTVRGGLGRGRHSGDSRWQNFIIGGCDAEGKDLSNELTMFFMQAALDTQTPHHTITLRVNKNTPLEVVQKGVEVVRSGIGMPAFVSDDSYVNYFTGLGFSKEDASEYAICGCLDAVIPGKSRTIGVKFFNMPQVMDILLHNGLCTLSGEEIGLKTGEMSDFTDFESLLNAYYAQEDHFMKYAAWRSNMDTLATIRVCSNPFRSGLMHDGLKIGKDFMERSFEPFDTGSTIMCVGGVNVINAFAAIKKLIFEDKKYTLQQLVEALDKNWEGFDQMRQDFIDAPKYGNNDDYADSLATDIYAHFEKHVNACPQVCGDKSIPSGISISAHQPAGQVVNASADGRYAHEILADGMISPQQGTDTHGPLAAFQSGMKIAQDGYQATLFNMKFHPTALKSDEDMKKLAVAVKTYLTNGGKQVQMNVVDQQTLKAAQADPEHYKELIVRVAGYSAYFTALTNMMQNEIIDRTNNSSVA